MKNKLIFNWLFLSFLSFFLPLYLKAQTTTPEYIKGLSGLPYTNPGNTLQVRFYLDFSVKINVPGNNPICNGFPRNTFETGTDSTGWLDFQSISLFSTTSQTGERPFYNLLPDIRSLEYLTPNYNSTQLNYSGVVGGSGGLAFPNYRLYIGGNWPNPYGTMTAGNFYFIPSGLRLANGCDTIKVESRFYNVIAQFRKKPTAQIPNPALEPYYCNGGGVAPIIAGGYSTGGGSSGSGASSGSGGGSTIRNLCVCGPQPERWLDVPDFPPTCTKVPLKVDGTTPVLFVDHPAGEASEILKATVVPGSKTDTGLKEVNFGITDDPTPSLGDWQLEDNKPHVWKLEYESNTGIGIFTIYKCGDSVKVTRNNIITRLRPNELEIKTSVQWSNDWPDSYAGMKLDLKVLSINKKEIQGSNATSSCTSKKGKHIWNRVTVVSNELMRDKVVVVGTFNIDLPTGVIVPTNQGNIRFQVETNYDPSVEGLAFPLSSTK